MMEEQQQKQKIRIKVQGKGVGLERRAGHNIVPFLVEGCWVFILFLCVYFISVCF